VARGNFGAARFAAARPFECVPRNLIFSIRWISGVQPFQWNQLLPKILPPAILQTGKPRFSGMLRYNSNGKFGPI